MAEENNSMQIVEETQNTTEPVEESSSSNQFDGYEIIGEEDGSVDTTKSETLSIGVDDSVGEIQEEVVEVKPEDREVPQQESSLNNENNTPEVNQDDSFISELNKRYETDFDSVEELNEYLDSEEGETPYTNEKLNNIQEFMDRTGRSVDEYLYMESLNFDEMSNEDIMKEQISRENPELSQEDIDFVFKRNYPGIGDEDAEGDEVRESQIELKSDASKLRQQFIEEKDNFMSGNINEEAAETVSAEQTQNQGYTQKEMDEYRNNWTNEMSQETDNLEGIRFTINDKGDNFVYNIPEADKVNMKKSNSNLDNFFNRYVDNKGNWNYDKLNTEMYVINNMDKVVKAIANQFSSQGREEVVKSIKNPSYEQPKRTAEYNNTQDIEGQIFDSMFGSGSTMRIK